MPVSLPSIEQPATHRTAGQPPKPCFRTIQVPNENESIAEEVRRGRPYGSDPSCLRHFMIGRNLNAANSLDGRRSEQFHSQVRQDSLGGADVTDVVVTCV